MNFSKYDNIIIKPRSRIIFRYNKDSEEKYEIDIIDYDEGRQEMSEYSVIGDLTNGYSFLYEVEDGGIIDYDGCLGKVYVCGYESNLGLSCNGLHQGYFQVDSETWERLCEKYNIMVEWCNK